MNTGLEAHAGGGGVDDPPEALRLLGQEYLRAMSDGDSVFTPGRPVWTLANAELLEEAFVNRPYEGGRSFDEKLVDQLRDVSDQALQLFAELWCMSLAPLADYNADTKQRLVQGILDKMSQPVTLPASVVTATEAGAFNGGVAFKSRRPFQIALLVKVAVAVLSLDVEARAEALSDPKRWGLLLASVEEPREPAQRRAVSWLLFPDYYLSIVSTKHLNAIRQAFADLLDGSELDLDEELFRIRQVLGERHPGGSFYAPPILDVWDPHRTLSGVPAGPEHLAGRDRFRSPGFALVSGAIDLIPEGRWVSYLDVATIAGLKAGYVGDYISEVEHPHAHRVIKHDGTTYRSDNQHELEAEGIAFDARGVADPSKRLSVEVLRQMMERQGLIQPMVRRAWLVRGNNVNGKDLVPGWLDDGEVTLSSSSLREVEAGISREELKPLVDEDYAHASYSSKSEKLDAFHNFLSRIHAGHLVVTVDAGKTYTGEVTGTAEYVAEDGNAHLRLPVTWHQHATETETLPEELQARLKVQRDVLDLTQQLRILEELTEQSSLAPISSKVALPNATEELAKALHVGQDWLQECIELLRDRPQLVFYGPPGTGKTYIAQRLAKHIAGDRVRLVQFHPSYSYEDFFEGYRPREDGSFKLTAGPMRRIVDSATENPSVAHVLIIDEMNRGNLAKVFGELYFLLEYREESIQLLYAREGDENGFNLPPNVFIIGTMNTADRSIALVDAAMRRRFAFRPLHPSEEPTNQILRSWLKETERPARVADLLDELNAQIADEDFKIGPSYFMRKAIYDEGGLERAWRTSILPLLEEHHYGEMSTSEVAARYGYDAIAARVDSRSSQE